MATSFQDYYKILGVPRTASDDDIKKAYRRLAREHHPDLHAGKDKDSHHRRMQEVNEAYAVLSSKENRAKYDQFGEHWKDGPPPPPPRPDGFAGRARSGSGGIDPDAFSDYFRDLFGAGARASRAEEMVPSEMDIEASLDISLEEAVRGVEKSFSLMAASLCQNCRGTGEKNGVFCTVCGGVGEVRRERQVKTKIPPGLVDGSRIRLRGQGNEGPRGAGDLYLQIHLLPDPRFKIEGLNLEGAARITPWRAALGGEESVPTLEGSVRVRVPKGTHSGNRLRLAGKGLGKPGERGDLFVRLEIDNPDLSTEMEALFKQMEEKSNAHVS